MLKVVQKSSQLKMFCSEFGIFLVLLKLSVRVLEVILGCLINMSPGLKYLWSRERGIQENSFKDSQIKEPDH